jgi:hypothetical protein
VTNYIIKNKTTGKELGKVKSEGQAFQKLIEHVRFTGQPLHSLHLSEPTGFVLMHAGQHYEVEEYVVPLGRPVTLPPKGPAMPDANPLKWNGRAAWDGWYGHSAATRHDPDIDLGSEGCQKNWFKVVYTDAEASPVAATLIKDADAVVKSALAKIKRPKGNVPVGFNIITDVIKRHVDTQLKVPKSAVAVHLYNNVLGRWTLCAKRYVNRES